jgi:hypothetical protein
MEHKMMFIPNNDEFETLLERFTIEYRKEFCCQIENGALDLHAARIEARDVILPNYPELEHCYKVHGDWHEYPIEEQPTAARLGRKVAGLMYGVSQDYAPEVVDVPETEEPPELSDDAIEHARWVVRSTFERVPEEEAKVSSRPTKTKIIADSLRGLKRGYRVHLDYQNEEEAKRDQVLIAGAANVLGWNKNNPPNSRAYQSHLTNYEQVGKKWFRLTIDRFEHPRPARRRNPRG